MFQYDGGVIAPRTFRFAIAPKLTNAGLCAGSHANVSCNGLGIAKLVNQISLATNLAN